MKNINTFVFLCLFRLKYTLILMNHELVHCELFNSLLPAKPKQSIIRLLVAELLKQTMLVLLVFFTVRF